MTKVSFILLLSSLLLMVCSVRLLHTPTAHHAVEETEESLCDDEAEDEDDEEDVFADKRQDESYDLSDDNLKNEEAALRRAALAHRLAVYVEPDATLPDLQRRAETNAHDLMSVVKADASHEDIAAVRRRLETLKDADSAMLREVYARYAEGLATMEDVLLTEGAYLQICCLGAKKQFAGLGHPARDILRNLQENLEEKAESKSISAAERAMARDKLTLWFPKNWESDWFPGPQSSDPLAANIFRVLAAQAEGNVVFSPYTLEKTLRLLLMGAGGVTREELSALPSGDPLPSPADSPGAGALFIAEEAPLHSDFTPPAGYENCVRPLPLRTQPAEAAQAINRWCRESTNGKIPTIITPADISPNVSMLAVNALYFKRNWLQPFDAEYTKEMDFHLTNGSTVRVPMMSSVLAAVCAQGEDWEAVAVPYTDSLYFIGILPRGNARDFACTLTHDKLHAIRTRLAKNDPEDVEIILPRFTCRSGELNLAPALKAQGLRSAFDLSTADFTGFTEGKLFLSALVQQNTIEFTEQGTTGASVTLAESDDGELAAILFNRPFLWLIGDLDSGAPPLFMGLTENPSSTIDDL